jgi:TRAP-type C4-dicarboxylate transport system substrate-binding protein
MRNFVLVFAFTIGATLFAPLLSLTAAEKWDMPMAYAPGNFHSQTAMMFARAVERATAGELKIVVHAGGSLFAGGEIKRAVQTRQAQIGEWLMSALSNENPMFGIDAVPFLATSFDQAWRLYRSSKPVIEKLLAEHNLVFLYATPWPPQGLYADRAVNAVSDMRSMEFRAYNPATSRLAQLMGATPTQIETAELSPALATGVANSLITSGATGVDRKVWEHLSHFYDLQAWLPKNMVFVNKQAWDALDERTRTLVLPTTL